MALVSLSVMLDCTDNFVFSGVDASFLSFLWLPSGSFSFSFSICVFLVSSLSFAVGVSRLSVSSFSGVCFGVVPRVCVRLADKYPPLSADFAVALLGVAGLFVVAVLGFDLLLRV